MSEYRLGSWAEAEAWLADGHKVAEESWIKDRRRPLLAERKGLLEWVWANPYDRLPAIPKQSWSNKKWVLLLQYKDGTHG